MRHAAEEFRHAYTLKSMIQRVFPPGIPDYKPQGLIGGFAAYTYVPRLNVLISRFLKERVDREKLKPYGYLLVTYAIEQRALMLYPAYDELLRGQPLSMKNIIREEKPHLAEIESDLSQLDDAMPYKKAVIQIEEKLFHHWYEASLISIG